MRAFIAVLVAAATLPGAAVSAWAESSEQRAYDLEETFVLGIAEHDLDAQTELTGWRLNDSWYLGQRAGKGKDTLSLVWQGERDQLSISMKGIRFTRTF